MDQLLLADLRQARQWAKLLAEDGRGRLSRELDATHISYCQTLMFPVIVDIIVVVIILGQTPREGQQKKAHQSDPTPVLEFLSIFFSFNSRVAVGSAVTDLFSKK